MNWELSSPVAILSGPWRAVRMNLRRHQSTHFPIYQVVKHFREYIMKNKMYVSINVYWT